VFGPELFGLYIDVRILDGELHSVVHLLHQILLSLSTSLQLFVEKPLVLFYLIQVELFCFLLLLELLPILKLPFFLLFLQPLFDLDDARCAESQILYLGRG
jgi:hypothetical protein